MGPQSATAQGPTMTYLNLAVDVWEELVSDPVQCRRSAGWGGSLGHPQDLYMRVSCRWEN